MEAADHWPAALIGAVFSGTPLGYGIGTILGGRLADRLPPRRLCWAAVGLLLAGFGVAFVWPSPLTFIASYAFTALGLGGGVALTGALAAAAQTFPRRVGSVGGLLTGTYALGAVVLVPVMQWLSGFLAWVDAIRLTGTALAALAVVAVLVMPSLPAPARAGVLDRAGLASVLARPRVMAGLIIEFAATPVGAYAFVNAGLYALGLRLGPAVAGAALVAASIGNAGGRLSGGALADWIGTGRVLAMMFACELAGGLLVAVSAPAGVVVGALACGLAVGAAAGAMTRMAADAAPDSPHSAFGLLFGGFATGMLTGPLLGAAIGRGSLPWILLSLLAIPGAVVALVRRGLATGAPVPGPARSPRT